MPGVLKVRVLLVGLGGCIGSVLRYLLSGFFQSIARTSVFPIGTLGVNLLGCFVIGILASLFEGRGVIGDELRVFLVVGVLGGFTTFSSFGNETLNLMRFGETLLAFMNIMGNVFFGIIGVWLGRAFACLVWR